MKRFGNRVPEIGRHMDVRFICDAHDKPLKLIRGKWSYYYRCPQNVNDELCTCRVSVTDARSIRMVLENAEKTGELLEGYTDTVGDVRLYVSKIKKDIVFVRVWNKRFTRKGAQSERGVLLD